MILRPVDTFSDPQFLRKFKIMMTYIAVIAFFKHSPLLSDPFADVHGSPMYSYVTSIFCSK